MATELHRKFGDDEQITITSTLYSTHLNFTNIDDVEKVTLITLLDDGLAGQTTEREHGVEYVGPFVFIEMGEQDIFADRFCEGRHRFVVFWHHLKV
jgi:hypothetical protein